MNSMTGYGRATVDQGGRQLTIELKSVNHRFLDLNFRMPRSFAFLEEEARKQISKKIKRGHVDVYATYRNLREDSKSVSVDMALVRAYQAALDDIAELTDASDDRTLMSIASLPDVLALDEQEEDQELLKELMNNTMKLALAELSAMRAREGSELMKDILLRVSALEVMTGKIEERYPDTICEYTKRLRARVQELTDGNYDEQRIAQEIAIMADRSAISEETVRLKSHIQQLREICAEKEPVGRKLDFIVQELNREVNTISSKSQDVPITQLVVSAKAEIEKMREQVQNIE